MDFDGDKSGVVFNDLGEEEMDIRVYNAIDCGAPCPANDITIERTANGKNKKQCQSSVSIFH
jgi:hypothetical protein